jgi:hypothetical protein
MGEHRDARRIEDAMRKIYVDNDFTLTLYGNLDISGGSASIRYEKPDGTTGEKPATVVDVVTAECSADFTAVENDVPGTWKFWLHIMLSDLTVHDGKTFKYLMRRAGK